MKGLQKVRTVLMLCGLILLFVMRMPTVLFVFRLQNLSGLPSVLNRAAYVLPQLGTFVLAAMFFKRRRGASYRRIAPLIRAAILIYTVCFAVECVLMIHYRMNIDLGLKLTLISRLLYFVGFAGTAVSFVFCDPTIFIRARSNPDLDAREKEQQL